jgi:hypothetical protein
MAQRKKWDPKRMKAAIEAIRNIEWATTKCPKLSMYHKQYYSNILKNGRKAQMKQSKQNWKGSKFFLKKQKMIWLSTVF